MKANHKFRGAAECRAAVRRIARRTGMAASLIVIAISALVAMTTGARLALLSSVAVGTTCLVFTLLIAVARASNVSRALLITSLAITLMGSSFLPSDRALYISAGLIAYFCIVNLSKRFISLEASEADIVALFSCGFLALTLSGWHTRFGSVHNAAITSLQGIADVVSLISLGLLALRACFNAVRPRKRG